MIQYTEPATRAVNCLPTVSLQEAVLGLKTPSPITVLLERGEGFFWQLRVESFPHFGKEQIKRRKTGASIIQADADRCKQTQADSQPCRRDPLTGPAFPKLWSADPWGSVRF